MVGLPEGAKGPLERMEEALMMFETCQQGCVFLQLQSTVGYKHTAGLTRVWFCQVRGGRG